MGVSKNAGCRCSCRYSFITPKIANHLDQNINFNKHKLSLLFNSNTVECNVSQHKKTVMKLSTMVL